MALWAQQRISLTHNFKYQTNLTITMRAFQPGDRVVSIAIMGLGTGIIYAIHFDGADVIWSDGRRSTERFQDLVYAGHDVDWKDIANTWTGSKTFEAEITRQIPISFANQIDSNPFWSNSFDNAVAVTDITTNLPISNAAKINEARKRAKQQFISAKILREGNY